MCGNFFSFCCPANNGISSDVYKNGQTVSTQIDTHSQVSSTFISHLADLINGDIIYKTLPRLVLLTFHKHWLLLVKDFRHVNAVKLRRKEKDGNNQRQQKILIIWYVFTDSTVSAVLGIFLLIRKLFSSPTSHEFTFAHMGHKPE